MIITAITLVIIIIFITLLKNKLALKITINIVPKI